MSLRGMPSISGMIFRYSAKLYGILARRRKTRVKKKSRAGVLYFQDNKTERLMKKYRKWLSCWLLTNPFSIPGFDIICIEGQLLLSVTSEWNKYHLNSTLVFLCYHFIPELRGRSPVGNIVLSLQVVHRAGNLLEHPTAPCWAQPPRQGSDQCRLWFTKLDFFALKIHWYI